MKNKDLIQKLQKLDPELPVYRLDYEGRALPVDGAYEGEMGLYTEGHEPGTKFICIDTP